MNRPRSNSRSPSRKWARAAAEDVVIGWLITALVMGSSAARESCAAAARDLVGRESLLGPRLQRRERQVRVAARLDRGADPLTPLGIFHAHHGALRDRRMRPQDLLHFERRHLVTAGLDDVHARAAK